MGLADVTKGELGQERGVEGVILGLETRPWIFNVY